MTQNLLGGLKQGTTCTKKEHYKPTRAWSQNSMWTTTKESKATTRMQCLTSGHTRRYILDKMFNELPIVANDWRYNSIFTKLQASTCVGSASCKIRSLHMSALPMISYAAASVQLLTWLFVFALSIFLLFNENAQGIHDLSKFCIIY